MTQIFELCYLTEKGYRGNVLFSSLDKANQYLDSTYSVGRISPSDCSHIVNSFIVDRVLF